MEKNREGQMELHCGIVRGSQESVRVVQDMYEGSVTAVRSE